MTIFGAIGLVLVTIGVYSVLGVHDGAADARNWDSNGVGSEELGRAGHGDSNGIAAGWDWSGAWG